MVSLVETYYMNVEVYRWDPLYFQLKKKNDSTLQP